MHRADPGRRRPSRCRAPNRCQTASFSSQLLLFWFPMWAPSRQHLSDRNGSVREVLLKGSSCLRLYGTSSGRTGVADKRGFTRRLCHVDRLGAGNSYEGAACDEGSLGFGSASRLCAYTYGVHVNIAWKSGTEPLNEFETSFPASGIFGTPHL